MIKLTYQEALELKLVLDSPNPDDLNQLIISFHDHLNQSEDLLKLINMFIGDDEQIIYLLANNFEAINMRDMEKDINMFVPETLTLFTNKRILSFKNIKNKAYYRSKNQIPGLERKFHLFDSCTIFKYTKIEQVFFVKSNLSIHYMNSTSVDKYDKGILNLELPDFCFKIVSKIIGNYM